MRKILPVLLAAAVIASPLATAARAQSSEWGVLDEMANRQWTTEKEPRPRVTKFRWIEPGRVLEARHGFASRLQFGEDKFADTVQRFVLDPKTGTIAVTYTYEDGRPTLKSVIKIEPDGSAVETFTDANGVKKRNIYKSPSLSLNAIERQELHGTEWATLGTTRKTGLTQFEIAENRRREEQARQVAERQRLQRIAAEQERQRIEMAEREAAEEQERAQQQAMQQNFPNPLQVLQGMASSMQQETARRQAQLDRQLREMQRGNSSPGGGSSGGYSSSSGSNNYGGAYSSSGGGYSSGNSGPSLTKKTMQVYFYVPTSPDMGTETDEGDGHNTHCQSNIFSVTIDWDRSLEPSGGNLKYANPVLDGMKSTFIDKCNRADPTRPTEGIADWYADAFSGWHPESLQLRKGDREVRMP